MLFSTVLGDPQSYWTTDSFTNAAPGFVAYGYNVDKGMDLNYVFLVYSLGKTRETTAGIRPVITIK